MNTLTIKNTAQVLKALTIGFAIGHFTNLISFLIHL